MDDLEAIRRLKARYFRCIDTKDWTALRDVFTDDVVMDTRQTGGEVVEGGDAYVAYLERVIGTATTVHHGHMPEIDLTSETTATGIWALHDIVMWPDGPRLDGYGHYHEAYRKVDGAWRIASSTITRLHTDFTKHPDGRPGAGPEAA